MSDRLTMASVLSVLMMASFALFGQHAAHTSFGPEGLALPVKVGAATPSAPISLLPSAR